MIELKNVSKWYGSFQVLTDCSTNIQKGEVVVVCGPSGSGKSTLIKTVHDPKTNLPKLRSRVGMVFQHFELFPHLSVTENLTIAQVKVLGRNPADAKTRGLKMLDRVGLTAHKDKFPGQLSGGQQQRVAIARALSMDPIVKVASRVIFMDVGGKILEDCSKDEFFGNPEARQPRTKEFLNKILQH
jgi:glutamate/aspartate transport system ATP-binding protein